MRLLLTVTLLSAGCDLGIDLDLSTDATSVTATARGDGTTSVDICAGPHGFLTCNTVEAYSVSMGALVVDSDALGQQLFGGRLAVFDDDRPESAIVVTRERDGAEMSVTLPAPFELSSPEPEAVVSRRAGVTLRFGGGGGPVTWRADATCDNFSESRSGDADATGGAIALRAADLPTVHGAECRLELVVEQRRTGRVDRAFPGGSQIHAVQERSVSVRLVP